MSAEDWFSEGESAGESASRSRGGSRGAEWHADQRKLIGADREAFIEGFNTALDAAHAGESEADE